MTSPVSPEDLMRFLDGELSPDQRAQVEAQVASSTELQREVALFRSLKANLNALPLPAASHRRSVWDDVNMKLNRPIGWGLLVSGLAVWSVYGAYLFATSATALWEKLATSAIAIGILMLLASVIWERYREWETDPYKDVQR